MEEKKNKKGKLIIALGLIIMLGLLWSVYAVITTTLKINADKKKPLTNKATTSAIGDSKSSAADNSIINADDNKSEPSANMGTVEFVPDSVFAYCVGLDCVDLPKGYSGPYFYNKYNLKDDAKSPSQIIADAGTIEVGKTLTVDGNKNDLVTINETRFFEPGAYIIYKVKLVNTGSEDMRLSDYDQKAINASISSSNGELVKNLGIEIYSDSDAKKLLTVYDSDKAAEKSSSNYLKPQEYTDWYIKVFYKYPQVTDNFETGEFSFNIQPIWTSLF